MYIYSIYSWKTPMNPDISFHISHGFVQQTCIDSNIQDWLSGKATGHSTFLEAQPSDSHFLVFSAAKQK